MPTKGKRKKKGKVTMLARMGTADFFKAAKQEVYLSEEYSSGDNMPEFAILDKNGNQICSWMRCKDFINDTIWSHKTGKSCSIYGWEYNPTKQPLSDRWLILAMRWNKHKLSPIVKNLQVTVEKLEKKLGVPKFKRSRFSTVKGHRFIVFGSPIWMESSALTSFFTWLLRAAVHSKDGDLNALKPPVGKDVYYYKNGKSFIAKLLSEGLKGFKDATTWSDLKSCSAAHNAGFIHYSSHVLKSKHVAHDGFYDPPMDDGDDDDDWNF